MAIWNRKIKTKALDDGSVDLGKVKLSDRRGELVGTFRVIAAPYNLQTSAEINLTLTFNEAIIHLQKLEAITGHEVASYQNDEEFYQALHVGEYNGEWVMPPKSIVEDFLFAAKNSLQEQGRLVTDYDLTESGHPHIYLTSTDPIVHNRSMVWTKNFKSGASLLAKKDGGTHKYEKFSVRLVRFEKI